MSLSASFPSKIEKNELYETHVLSFLFFSTLLFDLLLRMKEVKIMQFSFCLNSLLQLSLVPNTRLRIFLYQQISFHFLEF